jgi:hypothetical protein
MQAHTASRTRGGEKNDDELVSKRNVEWKAAAAANL